MMKNFGIEMAPWKTGVEFGLDRWRGFGYVEGPFWPIAIDWLIRPYNIASPVYLAASDIWAALFHQLGIVGNPMRRNQGRI
jgi:hypothetical protein